MRLAGTLREWHVHYESGTHITGLARTFQEWHVHYGSGTYFTKVALTLRKWHAYYEIGTYIMRVGNVGYVKYIRVWRHMTTVGESSNMGERQNHHSVGQDRSVKGFQERQAWVRGQQTHEQWPVVCPSKTSI